MNKQAGLVDFSIYSLPIEQQNAFKIILLLPIGALIVVIMRLLIGIRTSGTFMPILIALALIQNHFDNWNHHLSDRSRNGPADSILFVTLKSTFCGSYFSRDHRGDRDHGEYQYHQ